MRGGIEMKRSELNQILELHEQWVESKGESGAFANLRGAYLRDADLRDADLRGAHLRYADLRDADLEDADLRDAHLRGADLQGADLDFSCLPLWCGGMNFKIDERIAKQLAYHLINLMQHSNIDTSKVVKKGMFKWLKDSHLVTKYDLPILKEELNVKHKNAK